MPSILYVRGQIWYVTFCLRFHILPQTYKKINHCSLGTFCSTDAHSTSVLLGDISWNLFFFCSPSIDVCPLHPPSTERLTALNAKPSQLKLVTQKKISVSVLSNKFRKHLSVYYVPVAFTKVITTNPEVDTITSAAQKGSMICSGSWN